MNFLEAINSMDQHRPFSEDWNTSEHEPKYQDPAQMQRMYESYAVQPYQSTIGYISPYPENNWSNPSMLMDMFDPSARVVVIDNKFDPNKIFTSDIASLRTLASDQNKILKMFEHKLSESLAERGKIGVNEDDINAMQAVTAARNSIVNITKEQINIKKNIADIRLKQQQQSGEYNSTGVSSSSKSSSLDAARSIMDNLFSMPGTQQSFDGQYYSNVEPSSDALKNMESAMKDYESYVSDDVRFEPLKPRTVVVANADGSDPQFVTYDKNNNVIPDHRNPSIASIDYIDTTNREARIKDTNQTFPVKIRGENHN